MARLGPALKSLNHENPPNHKGPQPSETAGPPAFPTILFGAAYYDEYSPYDRLDEDVRMMKQAGITVVRIAESTWSTEEPKEGVFDFSHVDRVLNAMDKAGIKVIVGTPTCRDPDLARARASGCARDHAEGQEPLWQAPEHGHHRRSLSVSGGEDHRRPRRAREGPPVGNRLSD